MSWQVSTIGESCTVVNGGTPKTGIAEYWDGSHAWITPAEMGKLQDPCIGTTKRYLTDAGLSKCSASLLPPRSVILSSRAPIGHLIINSVPMATNQGCKGIITGKAVYYKYLYYFLFANVDYLNSLGTGATFKELSASKLKDVIIPLPPIVEQKRIVAILDEAFAGINQAIANTEKNLANARELFESYLNSVFDKKGEGWVEKNLGNICKNLDGKRVPITKSKRKKGNIPYYGASGVVDYVEDYLFDQDLLLVSEDGANLLARTYPIAFSISGKTWVNNHAHVLRFDHMETQKFVEFYLNSISLQPFVSGMAQPKLNQKSLNSIKIPLAPFNEQCDIVKKASNLKENSNRVQTIYQQKLLEYIKLKQSILQKAFTGELTKGAA